MTTALVVDDSSVDRSLVNSLLSSSTSLEIQYAENGAVALDCIRTTPPDIIITDLNMPEVNGLTLVETVHADFSRIPIVLITAHGSEELAVQALKRGAASYVPKASLGRDLVTTVMHVLAVSRAEHKLKEMRSHWLDARSSFQIPNDHNLISPLVGQIRELVNGMQLFDETEVIQLSMALEEAVSNALYHGNLELTAEQLDSVEYDISASENVSIVDTRREASPYKDRSIFVDVELNRDVARFTVRDEGPGFDHAEVPSPAEVVASEKLSGRGLTQMRLFLDEIRFNDRGNEVVLVKHVGSQ